MHTVLLLLVLLRSVTATTAERGTLTLVVRDATGQPLPGITVALFYDADEGRRVLGARTTDAQGTITEVDVPWGLYIVQFRGTGPDSTAIVAPERQNAGLLDDGSGIGNGFGVRFAEAERTELFVLATLPGATQLVPMFDAAPNAAASPQPIVPELALLRANAQPLATTVPAIGRAPLGALAQLGGVVLLLSGALLLTGYVRTRRDMQHDRGRDEVPR